MIKGHSPDSPFSLQSFPTHCAKLQILAYKGATRERAHGEEGVRTTNKGQCACGIVAASSLTFFTLFNLCIQTPSGKFMISWGNDHFLPFAHRMEHLSYGR